MAEGLVRAFPGEKYQPLPLLYRQETEAGRCGSNPAPEMVMMIVKIAPSSTVKKFASLSLDSGGRLRGKQPCCYRAHPWIRAGADEEGSG